jgi:HEAT repeat protein
MGFIAMMDDLLSALTDGDSPTKRSAAIRLGQLRDARAVSTLIVVMNHRREDDLVRAECAESLGLIGDARAVPHLVYLINPKNLQSDKTTSHPEVLHRAALNALILLGVFSVDAIGEALVNTPSGYQRGELVWGLQKIGHANAIPYLVAALKNSDDADFISACERALNSLGATDAVAEHLFALLEESHGTWFYHRAVEFVARTEDKRAVPYLIEALKNCDNAFDVIAIQQALKVLDGTSDAVIDTLLEKLDDVGSRWFHAVGATFLAEAGVTRALPHLLNALRACTHPAAVMTIARALVDLGARDTLIEVLIENLRNPDKQALHGNIAGLLANLDATQAIPHLREALTRCESPDDAINLEMALMRLGDVGAIP